ncbi:MAG TPA: hypothetical protein VIF61_08235 [Methylocystis sp.]
MGEAKEASPARACRELAAGARAKTFEPFLVGHFRGTFVNIQNCCIGPKAHMQENRRAIKVGGGRYNLFRGRFDPRDRRGTFSVNRHVNGCVHLHCILLHGEAHNRSPEVIQTTRRGQPRGWGSLRPNGSIAGPDDDLSPDPRSAAAIIAHGKGHPRRRLQPTAMCMIYTIKSLRLDLSADKTDFEGVSPKF